MASIDSSLAGWMKLHVFTTSTSAASGSRTSSCPRRASTPSITSLSTRFLGQPSVRRWTRRGSVTEVRELHGDAEVALAQKLDDRLQLVLLLARDPHLVALDGDLHPELRVLHQPDDLARLVGGDALLEVNLLLGGAHRPRLWRAELERPQRHLPLRHLLAQDVGERAQLEIVGRAQVDGRVLARHQAEHPARGLVALEARLEVALDPPEAGEEADRGLRLERLGERRLDHLPVRGLVDPERLAVADDELRVGRRVVPAHAVRLLEGERAA